MREESEAAERGARGGLGWGGACLGRGLGAWASCSGCVFVGLIKDGRESMGGSEGDLRRSRHGATRARGLIGFVLSRGRSRLLRFIHLQLISASCRSCPGDAYQSAPRASTNTDDQPFRLSTPGVIPGAPGACNAGLRMIGIFAHIFEYSLVRSRRPYTGVGDTRHNGPGLRRLAQPASPFRGP